MAIDDLLDEHEQGERVRAWLRQNGVGLVAGIALGLGAIGGWKWWENHQHQEAMAAADRYHAATVAVEAGADDAVDQVRALDGLYGGLAALELAASQARSGETDAAIATLRAVQLDTPALDAIVAQRLARLLIESGEPQQALDLLADATDAGAREIRGDARFALDQPEQAREDYAAALEALDPQSPRHNIVALKLTQVGGAPAEESTEATS